MTGSSPTPGTTAPGTAPGGQTLTPTARAGLHLAARLEAIRVARGVPALAGVLVRDGGATVVARVAGVRKWDVSHTADANRARHDDRFNIGSVSKPWTGYLVAALVQAGTLRWTTTIAEVFPELRQAAFRARYGIRTDYLERTVEQLMSHNAGLPYAPTRGWDMLLVDPTGPLLGEYLSREQRLLRRYNYVLTSLQDAPVVVPGPETQYGGGCIIVAAMAERRLGKTWEELMQERMFAPLGMTRSGYGRLATNATPDGIWQHLHTPATGAIVADGWTMRAAFDAHSHAPAGAIHTTVDDMARFIAANLPNSGRPKTVVSDALLVQMQAQPDAAESAFTRGGWRRVGSGATGRVWHNGDNCRSYADLSILPQQNAGYAAMCNVSNGCPNPPLTHIGQAAVNDVQGELRAMHDEWAQRFP